MVASHLGSKGRLPVTAQPQPEPILAPFANVSLSEDLHFIERAIGTCHRLQPVVGVPIVYTRHGRVNNTFIPGVDAFKLGEAVAPPAFVTEVLQAALKAAEEDAMARGMCSPVARHPPTGLVPRKNFSAPTVPTKCTCSAQRTRRACGSACTRSFVHSCVLHRDCRQWSVTACDQPGR